MADWPKINIKPSSNKVIFGLSVRFNLNGICSAEKKTVTDSQFSSNLAIMWRKKNSGYNMGGWTSKKIMPHSLHH